MQGDDISRYPVFVSGNGSALAGYGKKDANAVSCQIVALVTFVACIITE